MLGKVQAQVQVQVDARDRALAGLSNGNKYLNRVSYLALIKEGLIR
jgi:hypothetical protein